MFLLHEHAAHDPTSGTPGANYPSYISLAAAFASLHCFPFKSAIFLG